MIHVFCQLNNATMKTNYSIRRLEPILKEAAQSRLKHFFETDATNGFWAIKMYQSYAYKFGFSAYSGHYCYLRIGQGVTGGPKVIYQCFNSDPGGGCTVRLAAQRRVLIK